MLEYLVTSKTRRALLQLLWRDRISASASELARRCGASFSTTHRELQSMCRAGLARASRQGRQVEFCRDGQHPQAGLLEQLLDAADGHTTRPSDEQVRSWLAALGAPLAVRPSPEPPAPAEVLAAALLLARRDATVTRVLPVVLHRVLEHTALDALVEAAKKVDQVQSLGFLLHLTGHLRGDRKLVAQARQLRDQRRRKTQLFFSTRHGPRALAVARQRTPRIAREWGFVLNMGLDGFASAFEKHA